MLNDKTLSKLIKIFFSIHLTAAVLPVAIFVYAFDRKLYSIFRTILIASIGVGMLSFFLKVKGKETKEAGTSQYPEELPYHG